MVDSKELTVETVKAMSKEEKHQLEVSLGMTMPKNITDKVLNSLDAAMQDGKLHLPENYSKANALKSAWLELQEVKDKDGNPALKVCTQTSVAEALLNMVLNGLNPAKKQVYFIVYGTRLSAFVSVFGKMAIAKRIPGATGEPVARLIYKGDNVVMSHNEIGEEIITKHELGWEGKMSGEIIGAYATMEINGIMRSAVMNMTEIRESWSGIGRNAGRDHKKFTGEFAKRTVLGRLLKPIIQSSDDSYLVMSDGAFDKTEVIEYDEDTGEILDKEPKKELEETTIKEASFEEVENSDSVNNEEEKSNTHSTQEKLEF